MNLPFLRLPTVYHVGTMALADRGELYSNSQEGNGLSVSLCPEAWKTIARIGGKPLHKLSRPNSLFLDVLGLDEEVKERIAEWAITEGLAQKSVRFIAWRWDEEEEEWMGMTCGSREEALDELEDELDGDEPTDVRLSMSEDGGGPPGGSLLQEKIIHLLTKVGDTRTLGYGRKNDAMGILPMLWAEDVVRPLLTDLMGVWWMENYAPHSLSSPRGAVFPSMVGEFTAHNTEWKGVPSDEVLLGRMPNTEILDVAVLEAHKSMVP